MTYFIKLLSSGWAEALGWTLLHSLWQGVAIAFVIAILMIFLKSASSRLRYHVYFSGLILIIASATITFFKYLSYDSVIIGNDEISQIANRDYLVLGSSIANIETSSFSTFLATFKEYFAENMPLFVSLWFLGIFVFTLKFLGGLAFTQRLKHYRTKEIDTIFLERFQNLAAKIGLKKSVRYIESYVVKTPIVLNHLRPLIIIPVGMLSQMPTDQIDAIITHELAHIVRKDYIMNILQSVVEIAFFYHPAVWWLSANVRAERENICDDIAVNTCGNSLIYIKALASIQEQQINNQILAPAFSNRKNILLTRIQRMMKTPRLTPNYGEGFISALFIFISLTAISASAAISFNSEEINEPPVPTTIIAETQIPEKVYQVESEEELQIISENQFLESVDSPDTIIRMEKDGNIEMKIDGRTIEMEITDGKVVAVTEDGKPVSKADFEKYKDCYIDIQRDLATMKIELKEMEADIIEMEIELKESEADLKEIEEIKMIVEVADISEELEGIEGLSAEQIEKIEKVVALSKVVMLDANENMYFNLSGNLDSIFTNTDFSNFIIDYDSDHDFEIIVDGKVISNADFVDSYKDYAYDMSDYTVYSKELAANMKDIQHHYSGVYQNCFSESKTVKVIKKQLIKDGLMQENEKDFVFELDNKKMYINGEKQSKSSYKKYRKLIESTENPCDEDEFSYKIVF